MKEPTSLMLANLKCKESVIVYGRNEDGTPDQCFTEGRDYLFCFDTTKGELFTYDDVKYPHFLDYEHRYTEKHFNVITVGKAETFNLDEFTLARMKRLYKERRDFSE